MNNGRQRDMNRNRQIGINCSLGVAFVLVTGWSGSGEAIAQSGSVLVQEAARGDRTNYPQGSSARAESATDELNRSNEVLHSMSLFTVPMASPVQWKKNDLVHILVRETSKISSESDLEADKKYSSKGEVNALPLDALQNFVLHQAQIGNIDFNSTRKFDGTGEYTRDDDFTARITARVVEVLPNGHLVVEARTYIETDDETSSMKLSGVCDPLSVSPAGTILSSDIFDLRIVKDHEGELRKATKKGLFAKIVDAIFAF